MSVTLDHLLSPLDEWLNDPSVEEICVNKPGEVWVYSCGGYACHSVALGADDIEDIAIVAAAQRMQDVNEEHPILMTDLVGRGRVNAVVEPCVAHGFPSLTIRKGSEAWPSLAELAAAGIFRNTNGAQRAKAASNDRLLELYHAGRWLEFIAEAVRAGKNILGCGKTASGKTHFIKAVIREIEKLKRLVTIQNTPELNGLETMFPNSVQLFYTQDGAIPAHKLIEASMRMRPDWIVLQEILDGHAAMAYRTAMQTGHPCMSTIHAEDPEDAFEAVALKIAQSSSNMDKGDTVKDIKGMIDVVVHNEREDGFEVDQVWFREAAV